MSTTTVFQQLQTILEQHDDITFKVMEHEPAYTSEEAAKVRGTPLCAGAKALIMKVSSSSPTLSTTAAAAANTDDGSDDAATATTSTTIDKSGFVMVVIPADRKLASKLIRKALKVKKSLRFATREEVSDVTGGLEPGSIPPFGKSLFGLSTVLCDERLSRKASQPSIATEMSPSSAEAVAAVSSTTRDDENKAVGESEISKDVKRSSSSPTTDSSANTTIIAPADTVQDDNNNNKQSSYIHFNAGDHSISISMTFQDYVRVEQPIVGLYST